jgi:hypothetical protein
MSRGGGRGSRGGFSSRNEGPTLPWSLQQQVGGLQTGKSQAATHSQPDSHLPSAGAAVSSRKAVPPPVSSCITHASHASHQQHHTQHGSISTKQESLIIKLLPAALLVLVLPLVTLGAGQGRGGGSAGRGGRGSFGRGGGRGGARGSSSGGPPVFTHRPAKRKQQRKAARQEKKHHRYEVQQQHAQQRQAGAQQQVQQQPAAGSKRRLEVGCTSQRLCIGPPVWPKQEASWLCG